MRTVVFKLLVLAFILLFSFDAARAQNSPTVQEFFGSLASGQVDVYRMDGLTRGQKVTAFMETTSGNLDPLLAILPADRALPVVLDNYRAAVKKLVETSPQPLLDLPALRDAFFAAWDDDSGPGYSAALQFSVPQAGDYYLVATPSLSAHTRPPIISTSCLQITSPRPVPP